MNDFIKSDFDELRKRVENNERTLAVVNHELDSLRPMVRDWIEHSKVVIGGLERHETAINELSKSDSNQDKELSNLIGKVVVYGVLTCLVLTGLIQYIMKHL